MDLFSDHPALNAWLTRWKARCAAEDGDAASQEPHIAAFARAERMRRANPWIIPRNHRIEEALTAASEETNLEPFHQLLDALRRPYEEQPDLARFAEPAPADYTASYQTFCGT
jgi:uncharacterized protein YdiU (UPF0061 family)